MGNGYLSLTGYPWHGKHLKKILLKVLPACGIFLNINDELAKSRKAPFFVIPAKAGIQFFQLVTEFLDSGFHRSDDFLETIKFPPLNQTFKIIQLFC
jgi:hypothetical protein